MVFHRRRGMHAIAKRAVEQRSQKTKVRAIISLLGFAPNTLVQATVANASDTTRLNYNDTNVKPFSKIQVLHFDIALYQDGASANIDGFIDWFIYKAPGGTPVPIAGSTALQSVPFIFRTGRAAVPMLSSNSAPTIYHLSGDIKIPPRFQTMNLNDTITMAFIANPVGAGTSYSVNGVVTYMFKI